MSRPPRWRYGFLGLLAVATAVGMGVGSCLERSRPSVATAEQPAVSRTVSSPAMIPASFADLAESVQPAVVNIYTTKFIEGRGLVPGIDPRELPPPFREFFRQFMPPGNAPRRRFKQQSLGSGFIIDPEGVIVTNNHVIDGADEIRVLTNDGRSYDAQLVGTDPKTDIAVLRIQADAPLPYLEFGDSDKVRVGDWVIAVGNPFGLDHTVTAGIISAKGRAIAGGIDLPYQDFLQTDASINPGNSGGPLIDLEGKVIGVNTAIFTRTGQSAGIGFAVPANLAAFVANQIRERGRVVRGYLGVLIQPVDPKIAEGLGLDRPKGALVSQVFPDSPAAKAGIEVGDLIVAVNGEPIEDFRELPLRISTMAPGTKATITVLRDGKEVELPVVLGELPQEQPEVGGEGEGEPEPSGPKRILGMAVRQPTPEEREAAELQGPGGLYVESVAPDSPAAEAGIRAGDVVLRAGGQLLRKPEDLEDAVAAARRAGKKALLLLLRRDGRNRFVGVELPR